MADKLTSGLRAYAEGGGFVSLKDMQSLRNELGDPSSLRCGDDVVEIPLIDSRHPELGRDIYAASQKLFKKKGSSLKPRLFESAGEAATRALINETVEFSFK